MHSRKEERKARHAGEARWAFFFTSPHSLDPDPDSVTHIPWIKAQGGCPALSERGEPIRGRRTDRRAGELARSGAVCWGAALLVIGRRLDRAGCHARGALASHLSVLVASLPNTPVVPGETNRTK